MVISVIPMYFYSTQVESINRERLITNERLLQNAVTRSLADDIAQRQESLRMMLANLSSALQVASGGDLTSEHVEAAHRRLVREGAEVFLGGGVRVVTVAQAGDHDPGRSRAPRRSLLRPASRDPGLTRWCGSSPRRGRARRR